MTTTTAKAEPLYVERHGDFVLTSRGQEYANPIRHTMQTFHEPGTTGEVRALKIPGTGRGKPHTAMTYYRDIEEAVTATVVMDSWEPNGVYLLLNRPNPALFSRSPHKITRYPENTTSDSDVEHRRWILVDFDFKRPSGISATDEEVQAAKQLSRHTIDWLVGELRFPMPIEAFSGNGMHLVFPASMPNNQQSTEAVKYFLKKVSDYCEAIEPRVAVDQTVFNPARIFTIYGTVKRKGHNTPERPHRRSHLISVPAITDRISLDEIYRVFGKPESPQAKRHANGNGHHNGSSRRILVDAYLRDSGIPFREVSQADGSKKYLLDNCLFDENHKGKDAVIFQASNGVTTYFCFHDSCRGREWSDVKERCGELRDDHFFPPKGDHQQSNGSRFKFKTGRFLDPGQTVQALDRGNYGTVVEDHGDTATVHFVSPDGQEATKELPKSALADANGRPLVEDKDPPTPIGISSLLAKYPELRPPIIEGLLREGETMGVHAKSKVGKSWFGYHIALSIASRSFLLGRFRCEQSKVLIIDNELHPENLANRIPRVASTMGLYGTGWEPYLDVIPLRGKLRNIQQLQSFFESIAGQYKFVLLDALYRLLPPGVSENDNAQMADVFNTIDQCAYASGAAIGFIHHASKGDQSGKDVVDVGSGAGSIARAVDTHLVIRPHKEPDHAVVEAALRSFAPIDPLVIRWEFPIWTVADDMNPSDLRGKNPNEEKQLARDEEGRQVILSLLEKGGQTRRQLRTSTGMGFDRSNRLISQLIQTGDIREMKIGEHETIQIVNRSGGLDL